MIDKTLKQLYTEHTGKISDKWSIYLAEYDRIFSDYRHKSICMLEIGTQNGGSLEIWAKYFLHAQHFVGSDINPDCAKLAFDDARINVVVADANTDEAQRRILGIVSSFDIIIDDGSHRSSDIVKTFARYFPMLVDGGVFVVEDLHCSYWKEFEGGLFDPYSSLAFFKKLADIISHEHWGVTKSRSSVLVGFFSKYGILIDEETLQHIHSVEFVNSMCVIRKLEPECNILGVRFVTGVIEAVVTGNKNFSSIPSTTPVQTSNQWSTCMAPEDEVLVRKNQISNLEQRQSLLNAAILSLQQEKNSSGAAVGRAIDRLLPRFAPGGSLRQRLLSLLARLVRTLESSGVKVTMKRVLNFLIRKIRSKQINFVSDQGIGVDHPQLSQWFDEHEPDKEQLILQTVAAKQFQYSPWISTIVPVYKVPREVLEETIGSLEYQTYPNWQACIVWADTEDLVGWEWLKDRTATDPRFKIKLLAENGGISRNSDAALELVEGDFIALLDHDDILTPWAFFEIVSLLQSRPDLDFIYSDKDSIRADGRVRMNALFKPDWSPEMLHSVNYLTHLNIIRTSLMRSIGGWRPETDGAQDWDLFFRITEQTKNIARVASILYHWRILPTSTASGLHTKPYAALAQLRTQQDYFMRRGLAAAVVPTEEGMFRVCWMVRPASIDVVVYQTGTYEQLKRILSELMATEQPSIRRVHVIYCPLENETIALDPFWVDRVTFTCSESANWCVALKVAVASAKSQTLVLLDGGACGISTNIVEELGCWVTEHPDIAWASALVVSDDETVYEAGRVVSEDGQSAPLFSGSPLRSFGWFGGPLWYRNSSACSPYAVAMKADGVIRVLSQLKNDEQVLPAFSTFCQQLAAKDRRGLINPFARVYFKHAPEKNWANEGKKFHSDPYFSPAFAQVSPLRLHS
jgi:hypothetical protein